MHENACSKSGVTIYNDGYKAGYDNMPKNSNPYPMWTHDHSHWNRGWDAGNVAQRKSTGAKLAEARQAYASLMEVYASEAAFTDAVRLNLGFFHGYINGLLEAEALAPKEAYFFLHDALPQVMHDYISL